MRNLVASLIIGSLAILLLGWAEGLLFEAIVFVSTSLIIVFLVHLWQRQSVVPLGRASEEPADRQSQIDYLERQRLGLEAERARLADELKEVRGQLTAAQDEFLSATHRLNLARGRIIDLEETAALRDSQIEQMLALIRQVTGIDGKLSPETLSESLPAWRDRIHVELQTFAEREAAAEMRAREAEDKAKRLSDELDKLRTDHLAVDDAYHELLNSLGLRPSVEQQPEVAASADQFAGDQEPTAPGARRADGALVPPVPMPIEEESIPPGDPTEPTPSPEASEPEAGKETGSRLGAQSSSDRQGLRLVDLSRTGRGRRKRVTDPE